MENFASFYYLQTLLIIDSKQDNDINSSILQATCTCIKKRGSNYNLHCEIQVLQSQRHLCSSILHSTLQQGQIILPVHSNSQPYKMCSSPEQTGIDWDRRFRWDTGRTVQILFPLDSSIQLGKRQGSLQGYLKYLTFNSKSENKFKEISILNQI